MASSKTRFRIGSVLEVSRRLSVWCQYASEGFARVEYASEVARHSVIQKLSADLVELRIPFLEVSFKGVKDIKLFMDSLIDDMQKLGNGVVTLTDIEEEHSQDIIDRFDLYREQLSLPQIRQIWWILPSTLEQLINTAPDLNTWFTLRLSLKEVRDSSDSEQQTEKPSTLSVALRSSEEANNLRERIERSKEAGMPKYKIIDLVKSAVDSLLDIGAKREAQDMIQSLLPDLEPLEAHDESVMAKAKLTLSDLHALVGQRQQAEVLYQEAFLLFQQNSILDPSRYPKHNLPRSGVRQFVGRWETLQSLHRRFQMDRRLPIIAIEGMGGIGKTELVLQYSFEQIIRNTYPGGILWIQCRDQEIGEKIVVLAQRYWNINPPSSFDLESQVSYCWQNWPHQQTLLILDDVTDNNLIKRYLPNVLGHFKVLVTTRIHLGSSSNQVKIGSFTEGIELEVLSLEASLQLLSSWVGSERVNQEIEVARQIAEWVGYLPLGLELVGRHLSFRETLPLSHMFEDLQRHRLRQLEKSPRDKDMTGSLGVKDTFELSWQELDPVAQKVACVLSVFGLAPIPWGDVVERVCEEDPWDLEQARDNQLVQLHLLQEKELDHYVMHPLIREFCQTKLLEREDPDEIKQRFAVAMVAIADTIQYALTRQIIEQVREWIPHITEVAQSLYQYLEGSSLTKVFVRLGWYYQGQGIYGQAEQFYRSLAGLIQVRGGDKDPELATCYHELAGLYKAQGNYTQAEEFYLKSLAIRETVLPSSIPI